MSMRELSKAEALVERARLTLAVRVWEEAQRLTETPQRRGLARYNLGVAYWTRFGDGVEARRKFLASAAEFKAFGYGNERKLISTLLANPFRVLHASAIENAMLCALSFDEFDQLAAQLRALRPDMPILAGLVPVVSEARENGQPWSHLLFRFADSYYNRNDPKLDRGHYGEAKSTYHLLLAHRRELRLARDDWRMATFEYCALSLRMATVCIKVRGGDADPYPPEEFLPILTDAFPLVDEYLAVHSGDKDVEKARADMQWIVTNARGRWLERTRSAPPASRRRLRCKRCHQPIEDSRKACAACGNPSKVMKTGFIAALGGALLCGGP